MSSKNAANPVFNNNVCEFEENEAKANFMKFKNQDVLFFNRLPHFDCDSPKNDKGIEFGKSDNCPTKKANFFKNSKNSFNQRKNFNSYLFQNK